MIIRLYTILITTTILLINHSLALPTIPLNTTNLTGMKTSVVCHPSTIFGSRLADTRDCLQAALLLPDGADPGLFHTGHTPSDDFELPVAETYGSCVATVVVSGVDRSSWDHISWIAAQMIAICSTGQFPQGQTGGITYAGSKGKIRVSVERVLGYGQEGGGGGNVTALS